MFSFFKKENKVFSPMSGKCVSLEEVPDEAFSQKLLGDGVALIPSDGKIVAPFDCVVEQVFDTHHAYVLKGAENLEVLLHIGINTVELKGQGFENKVEVGQDLSVGDLISYVDIDFISSKGYALHTPLIFTNNENFKFDFKFGEVKAGLTEIAKYRRK